MHITKKILGLALAASFVAGSAVAQERELVINVDRPGGKTLEATQQLIADFEAKYPDVKVKLNNFDPEGYKAAIRNFLTADAPDIAVWFPGNRMAPFVDAGLFAPVDDVWDENNFREELKSSLASMERDGKVWGVPFTFAAWALFRNEELYEKAGAKPADNWEDFLANCEKFAAIGVDCITTGTKSLWPGAGLFDLINMRVNGYEFHMELANGKIPWTDDRVKATFTEWAKLQPYITKDHAALDWDDAAAQVSSGKAANYLIGTFVVRVLKEGGMTDETIGIQPFPTINPDVPRSEEAPINTYHMAANAKNPEDARKFLAFVGSAEHQTKYNQYVVGLPVNNKATPPDDKFLTAAFEMLSGAHALSQFFDRDAPADMAKSGMEGFQEFMSKPERVDQILERLESVRQKVYK